MKTGKTLKIAIFLLTAGLLLQTGILVFSSVSGGSGTGEIDVSSVVISEEIQDLIKEQDRVNYDKNIKHYKEMIILLNVHDEFKNHMENMVRNGKKITDIMTAYTFLHDCYGKISQLESLVEQREAGESWTDVFSEYNRENGAFKPRNFDFNYLESLMEKGTLTADDIMIADRISQNAGVDFSEVISEKESGKSWKDICVYYGIVNGQETIPRVQVTQEQLKKYTAGKLLTEEQVIAALVAAHKLGLDEQEAIDKAKKGYTTEQLFAEALERKYY